MKISIRWYFILLILAFSITYVLADYGEPDVLNDWGNDLLSDPIPPEIGFHQLRFVVNDSDNRSVDANENGIIDLAEALVGGSTTLWRFGLGFNITPFLPEYRVVIGGIAANGSLLLDVNGDLGASRYCDSNGTNCYHINSLASANLPTCGIGETIKYDGFDWVCSNATGGFGVPDFASGWTSIAPGEEVNVSHNLGTNWTLVYLEFKGEYGINQIYLGGTSGFKKYGTNWKNKNETIVTVYREEQDGIVHPSNYEFNVYMWVMNGSSGSGSGSMPDCPAAGSMLAYDGLIWNCLPVCAANQVYMYDGGNWVCSNVAGGGQWYILILVTFLA